MSISVAIQLWSFKHFPTNFIIMIWLKLNSFQCIILHVQEINGIEQYFLCHVAKCVIY